MTDYQYVDVTFFDSSRYKNPNSEVAHFVQLQKNGFIKHYGNDLHKNSKSSC